MISNGRREAGGFNTARIGRHRERIGRHIGVSRSDRVLRREFCGAGNIELRRLQRQITQVRGCRESTCGELGIVEHHGVTRHNRGLISNGRRKASGFNAARIGRHRERSGLNRSVSSSDRVLRGEFHLAFSRQFGTGGIDVSSFSRERDSALRRRNHSIFDRQITQTRGCRESTCGELGIVEHHGVTRHNRGLISNGRREAGGFNTARLGRHRERSGFNGSFCRSDRLLSREFGGAGNVDLRRLQRQVTRLCGRSECAKTELGAVKRHRVARLNQSLTSNGRREACGFNAARIGRHRERIGLNGSFSRSDRLLRGEFHLVFSCQCCTGGVDIGSFSRERDSARSRLNVRFFDRQITSLRSCRESTCTDLGAVKRHRVVRLNRSLISNSRREAGGFNAARIGRHRERSGLNRRVFRSDRLIRGEFHLVFSRQCCTGGVDIGSFSREREGTFGRVDGSSECGKPLRGNCAHCTAREICAVKHQILTSRERGRSRNLALQLGSGEALRRSDRERSGLNGGIRDLDIFICRDRNRFGCQERGVFRDDPCEAIELNLARCGLDRRIGEVKRPFRRNIHVARGFNRGAARERDAAAHSGDECPSASLGLEPCRIDAAARGADFDPAARTEFALSRGDRFTKERCIARSLNNAACELQLARLCVKLHAALGADGRVVSKLDPGLFRRHGEILILTRRLQIARKRDLLHGVKLNRIALHGTDF